MVEKLNRFLKLFLVFWIFCLLLPHVNALNEKIDFGILKTGSIASPESLNTYTFSGEPDDAIVIRITKTGGDLWPRVTLVGPSGEKLNFSYGPANSEIAVRLTTTGTHKILVDDGFQGKFTGNYSLFVQRINNPGNVKSLEVGISKISSINQPGMIDTYSFSGNAGDALEIRIRKTGGELWPRITLYGPTGKEITRNYGVSTTEILSNLTSSGPYTLLVDDGFWGEFTGDYSLLTQIISLNGGSIASPQTSTKIIKSTQTITYTRTVTPNQATETRVAAIPIWDRNNLIYVVLLVFVFLFGAILFDTYYKKKK